MAREIEIKFAVDDEEKMLRKLLAFGAEKVCDGLEHNIVFDNGEIRKKGILLRLRKTGDKSVLTFKTNIRKAEFKEADEIEIGVSDFQKVKEILEGLGYEAWWIYEKQKTKFVLGDVTIALDRLPFGTFIEIEGSEGGIRRTVERLGLDLKKGIRETYLELYQNRCKEKGIEMENLIFWRKAKVRL